MLKGAQFMARKHTEEEKLIIKAALVSAMVLAVIGGFIVGAIIIGLQQGAKIYETSIQSVEQ
jgi:hypothetical protein